MTDIDRIIIELNKRIQNAEAQNQQMERRIKELEEQTNSLGIIEPGQEDFLVGGMIHIISGVDVNNEDENIVVPPGLSVRRELGEEGADDKERWVIAKLPQPTLSFQSFLMQGGYNGEIEFPAGFSPGGIFGSTIEVFGIQEDFNINDVTFDVADAFDIKLIGDFSISVTISAPVEEDATAFGGSDYTGAAGFIDIGTPGSLPDSGKKYFGIVLKIRFSGFELSRGVVFGSGLGGPSSVAFYSPNSLLS